MFKYRRSLSNEHSDENRQVRCVLSPSLIVVLSNGNRETRGTSYLPLLPSGEPTIAYPGAPACVDHTGSSISVFISRPKDCFLKILKTQNCRGILTISNFLMAVWHFHFLGWKLEVCSLAGWETGKTDLSTLQSSCQVFLKFLMVCVGFSCSIPVLPQSVQFPLIVVSDLCV